MSTPDFNPNDLHTQRMRVIRVGDIVSDTGWRTISSFQVRVVVHASKRTEERSTWFTDMVFGDQHRAEEVA